MKLWLQGITPSKKVDGVTALRKIAVHAGITSYATVGGAGEMWSRAATGHPTLLIHTDDPAVMQACVDACERGGLTYAQTQDNEFPPEPENSQRRQRAAKAGLANEVAQDAGNPSDPEESIVAAQVGTLMMAVADGNPNVALSFTRSLQRITGHALYQAVAEHLMETFPDPETLAEWLAENSEDEA